MKMPNTMRRFGGKGALFIAAGKQDAALYVARGESVERIDAFKVPTPHYSDNEGSYGVPGRGSVTGSGGTRERRDDDVIREFLKELKEKVKRLDRGFESVFVFAPAQTKNRIASALPVELRKRVAAIIEGNYYGANPLDLAKMALSAVRPEGRVVLNPEAQKILDVKG